VVLYKKLKGENVEVSPEEEAEIRAGWAVVDAEIAATKWAKDRINEYPKIEDQLDMLWHELDIYGTIEKNGPWFKAIEAVKVKNPKPE